MNALSNKAPPPQLLHPLTSQHCYLRGVENGLAKYAPDEKDSPADKMMPFYLPVTDIAPIIQFISDCAENCPTTFVIYVEYHEDSRHIVKPKLPKNCEVEFRSADRYEFPKLTPQEAHAALASLGFVYVGANPECIETARENP